MLTATTEMAIRALIFLASRNDSEPASPKEIAEEVGESPSYMAKVTGMLAKAGILRARQGLLGGIQLSRSPSEITLLEIVQACQNLLVADYCHALGEATSPNVCAFHQAMFELQASTIDTLSRWNLAMLASKPLPTGKLRSNEQCRMLNLSGSCKDCQPKRK